MFRLISFVILTLAISSCSKNECNPSLKADCFCTLQYNPVCGCDDVTYGNACAASCNSIGDFTTGACKYSIQPLLGTWVFLGYESEGAAIGHDNKSHIYDMYLEFGDSAVQEGFEINGKSSTNFFGGQYHIQNKDKMSISTGLMTKIGCIEAACDYETKFIKYLNADTEYKIEGNFLSLSTRIYTQDDNPKPLDEVLIFMRK